MERFILSKDNLIEGAQLASKFISDGGVVLLPTDTVYGLASDAKNIKAIEKIFIIKGRAKEKALPVFISSFEMLTDVAYIKDKRALDLLKKFWPGALTAILYARGWMPVELRAGELTIGVRMPDYNLVLNIIKQFKGPITGTSANLSSKPASGKIEEVISQFKHMPFKPDLVLDAGDLPESEPSTVVDCTVWPPKVLREGGLSEEDIKKVL